ncbi:MAG: hypothetical protein V1749_04645 [Candidatus Desantisbacteria bacterium]
MIKKLSMMVLGVAVVGFCMATVPEGKAEAAARVYNVIWHPDCGGDESGVTKVQNVEKDFELYGGKAKVDMGRFGSGKATAWAKMDYCRAEDTQTGRIRWYHWKYTFWLQPR